MRTRRSELAIARTMRWSWGLAAMILLAAAGLGVKVIKRLGVVGGRTSAIAARGFKLDLGPTFFLFRAC